MRKPSRQTVSSRCFSLLCLLKLARQRRWFRYSARILWADTWRQQLQSIAISLFTFARNWTRVDVVVGQGRIKSSHIIRAFVNYFTRLRWSETAEFSSSLSDERNTAAAVYRTQRTRWSLELTFRTNQKQSTEGGRFPPFLSIASSFCICAVSRGPRRDATRFARREPPPPPPRKVFGLPAATSTSQPSIHGNNGAVPPSVPVRPRRLNATVYHPAVLAGPPFSPRRRIAPARPGCLRRIPRRNLRIHTQPGLRINALLPSTTRSCRASASRLASAPPCFLFSSSPPPPPPPPPSFFSLFAPFRVFDVSYPVINLRSHSPSEI